jgi:membrane protease YdiL (CAAX protease family)
MAIDPQRTLDLRGIGWFLLIAFGGAWLLALPLWLDPRGLSSPWAALILAMNFTPAVATLIVTRWIRPLPHVRKATGLRRAAPGRRWGRYWLFGWLAMPLFVIAAPFVGALFGLFPLDLQQFSGLRAWAQASPQGAALLARVPPAVYAWTVVLTLPLQALLLTPFTFGEEWGWRGYLLPQLLPIGQGRALLASGVIWGLWHAPVVLLGFNYPLHPPLIGLLLMVIFSTIMGTLLGWTRLATGSVWPAVLGHAGMDANQVLGGVLLLMRAGATIDTAQVLIGWTGWLLPLLCIAVLARTGRLPVRDAPDLARIPGPAGVARVSAS